MNSSGVELGRALSVALIIGFLTLSCIPKQRAGAGPVPATLPAPAPNSGNPFLGVPFFVDASSQAAQALPSLGGERAVLVRKIAEQPQADWFGEWTPDVESAVRSRMQEAEQKGALRVLVAYNIPNRDCGLYSKGGVGSPEAYKAWITALSRGIGRARAAVILEPDALGQLKDCLTKEDQATRVELLRYAVRALRASPNVAVYLDAGNANWLPPPELAGRLSAVGIHEATGFALNVSNYVATDLTLAYGHAVNQHLRNPAPFVIDTSRNGRGEAPGKAWCNPKGRALGPRPTANTGHPLLHALLWVKRPGESDGDCNGGPRAGAWFGEQAYELARNAGY